MNGVDRGLNKTLLVKWDCDIIE